MKLSWCLHITPISLEWTNFSWSNWYLAWSSLALLTAAWPSSLIDFGPTPIALFTRDIIWLKSDFLKTIFRIIFYLFSYLLSDISRILMLIASSLLKYRLLSFQDTPKYFKQQWNWHDLHFRNVVNTLRDYLFIKHSLWTVYVLYIIWI